MKAGQKIMSIGSEDDPDVDNAIARAMATMDSIKKAAVSKKLVTPRDASDAMFNLLETYSKPQQVINSGYYDLDEITTGFRKGELTIIGARPSVGKSQLMFDISENVSTSSKVLFISAEMTKLQIMERKAARELGVPVKQLRKGELTLEQQDKIVDLSGRISEQSIHYVLESVGTNDIERELNVMLNTTGCDIVFVDYLQFLMDCRQQGENQNIRVGRAMKALKSMVVRYEIPFIVASQLSRGLETRENKRPTLSDLRDSGEIEQDADNVLLLYRGIDEPQYLEIYQAKNRQIGSQPAIRLLFHNERYVNAR
jgi:replicative DNA helicase